MESKDGAYRPSQTPGLESDKVREFIHESRVNEDLDLFGDRHQRIAKMASRYQSGQSIWDGAALNGWELSEWRALQLEEPEVAIDAINITEGKGGDRWRNFLSRLK
jgi:hypothetical protein